jgi:hypothetical protein
VGDARRSQRFTNPPANLSNGGYRRFGNELNFFADGREENLLVRFLSDKSDSRRRPDKSSG